VSAPLGLQLQSARLTCPGGCSAPASHAMAPLPPPATAPLPLNHPAPPAAPPPFPPAASPWGACRERSPARARRMAAPTGRRAAAAATALTRSTGASGGFGGGGDAASHNSHTHHHSGLAFHPSAAAGRRQRHGRHVLAAQAQPRPEAQQAELAGCGSGDWMGLPPVSALVSASKKCACCARFWGLQRAGQQMPAAQHAHGRTRNCISGAAVHRLILSLFSLRSWPPQRPCRRPCVTRLPRAKGTLLQLQQRQCHSQMRQLA
jgi:hypothetical protein